MAHLQRMAQRQSIHLTRQELEEALEILGIELLAGHELPVDRPQPVAEHGDALTDEAEDGLAGVDERLAIGAETRRLHREDEAVGRLLAPLGPARGLEGRIVGSVDFDRGEAAAGEFELPLVRQPLRIERTAPGLIGPAADADVDLAFHGWFPSPIWPSFCCGIAASAATRSGSLRMSSNSSSGRSRARRSW